MDRAQIARPALLAGVLVLAALAAHSVGIAGGFVFDDHVLLLRHDAIVRLTLPELWLSTKVPDYWPLTWTSLWVEWRLWGGEAWGFHATNLLLHVGASLLLWRVLLAFGVRGAWLAALLFAVHPVSVESVAWISERKNPLSAVLVLGSVLAWLRAERARSFSWGSLSLFVLALLAKTSVVFVPVVLAAIVAARDGWRATRAAWLRLAPFFAASLAAGLITLWFQREKAMELVLLRPRGFGEKLGGAGWAIASYLERAIAPVRVHFVYPEWPARPDSAWFYLPLAAVLVGPALAWLVLGRWRRPVLLAYGYSVLALLPVVGLLDIAYMGVGPMSNHLQYLAMIGPIVLGAMVITTAIERWRVARIPAAAVVVALVALTATRARAFESDLTLWRTAARETPDQLFAVSMYTRILRETGDREGSARELRAARAAATDPATQLRIQSLLFQDEGAIREAVRAAAAAEQLRPDPSFQHELGWKVLRSGDAAGAVAVFEPLDQLLPRSTYILYGLGVSLGASGRIEDASEALRRACDLAPRNAKINEAYAMALARLGRLAEAREHVAVALGTVTSDPRVDAQLAAWGFAAAASR